MTVATTAAVSVRKRCLPSEIGLKPFCSAKLISSSEKSPSGPIKISVSRSFFTKLPRYSLSPNDELQWAINLSPSKGIVKTCFRGVRSWSVGWYAFSDCLTAAVITFYSLSCLICRRSLWKLSIGYISETPTSVAFSKNHSKRSIIFVGATAITKR